MSQATLTHETSDKSVLTYSALNTFRNCPRKYKHRYVDNLRPRMKVESLSFGSVIHSAIEIWYRSVDDANRLWIVLDFIDRSFPERATDENQQANWHLARAIMTGYASRYATEDFTIIEIEKSFTGNIRNPDTGRCSQTFVMAGKADAIVQRSDGMYLLEHKTAASIDSNYLDKLWTDTQIALYCYYLLELGYPIVGVIYNVLLKSRLKQSKGETQEEYEARHAELAAKNKSGKSTAKRQMPETNEEFQGRWQPGTPSQRRSIASSFISPKTVLPCCKTRSGRSLSSTSTRDVVANGYSTHRAASPISDRASICLTANPASIQRCGQPLRDHSTARGTQFNRF